MTTGNGFQPYGIESAICSISEKTLRRVTGTHHCCYCGENSLNPSAGRPLYVVGEL